MTRRELLARLDSRELSEWIAFMVVQQEEPPEKESDPKLLEAKIKNEFEMYNMGLKK